MSKKDYSHLTADEVTAHYGDLLEKQMNIMRDKNKGALRTLFSVAAFWIPVSLREIHAAVLEKNGVEKIKADGPVCHDYMPEVIAAVETRGSNAAAKIKLFEQFKHDCNDAADKSIAAAPEVKGPFSDFRKQFGIVKARTEAAKSWQGPATAP